MKKQLLISMLAVAFPFAVFAADTEEPIAATPSPEQQLETPEAAATPQEPASEIAAPGAAINEQTQGQLRANELVGMDVSNPNEENVGKIDDLLFDEDGRMAGVILSVGGFLGLGDKLVGLPWDEVTLDPGQQIAFVNLGKEQLEAMPAFKTRGEIMAEQEAERARQEQMQQQLDTQPAQPPAPQ